MIVKTRVNEGRCIAIRFDGTNHDEIITAIKKVSAQPNFTVEADELILESQVIRGGQWCVIFETGHLILYDDKRFHDSFQPVESEIRVINKSEFPSPSYATLMSAGLDLQANMPFDETDKLIAPLERYAFPTGIFIELPEGYEAQIRPRSGMAIKHGITVLNSPGTIDADYRGEIKVILVNLSDKTIAIPHGTKIAQMVIAKYERVKLIDVDELGETVRGAGGFGSTGK